MQPSWLALLPVILPKLTFNCNCVILYITAHTLLAQGIQRCGCFIAHGACGIKKNTGIASPTSGC